MIGDHLLPDQPGYMLDHFYYDGIIDTFIDLAGAMLGYIIVNRMRGIRGMKQVFPQGSLKLLLVCFITTSMLGPMVTAPLEWNMNYFAIGCILLTMIIYLIFLIQANLRIRISTPSWISRMAEEFDGGVEVFGGHAVGTAAGVNRRPRLLR